MLLCYGRYSLNLYYSNNANALQHTTYSWETAWSKTNLCLHPEKKVGAVVALATRGVSAARCGIETSGTRCEATLFVTTEEHSVTDKLSVLVVHIILGEGTVVASGGTHNGTCDGRATASASGSVSLRHTSLYLMNRFLPLGECVKNLS
jgi:hypothetical protein